MQLNRRMVRRDLAQGVGIEVCKMEMKSLAKSKDCIEPLASTSIKYESLSMSISLLVEQDVQVSAANVANIYG